MSKKNVWNAEFNGHRQLMDGTVHLDCQCHQVLLLESLDMQYLKYLHMNQNQGYSEI